MAIKKTLVCDRCGKDVPHDGPPGELRAGEVQLSLPGRTYRRLLCADCIGALTKWWGRDTFTYIGSTAYGLDVLEHLPVHRRVRPVDPPRFAG